MKSLRGSMFVAGALALAVLGADVAHAEPPAPVPAQAPAPAPAPAEIPAADAAKLVAFFESMLDVLVANKTDCAKAAAATNALIDKNRALLVRLKSFGARPLPKDAEAKLSERMTRDMAALEACATDKAMLAAMKRIGDPDLPPPPSAAVLAQVKAPVAADLATYEKQIRGKGDLIANITTPQGTVRCQLLPDKAPITVANFIGLATGQKPWLDPRTNKLQKGKHYYDGTVFHRVIPGFMIQGGDPTGTGMGGPGYEFTDEANDLTMEAGMLAMANAGPNTNGSQFFITEGAATYLNGKHTIFGRCAALDVVTKIVNVPRDADDRPNKAVKMKVTITRGTL